MAKPKNTEIASARMSTRNKILRGHFSNRWQGDTAGYHAKHQWVAKYFGRPQKCEGCGVSEIPKGRKQWFEWANVSGKYLRERCDWKRLCKMCHAKMDAHLMARGEKHGNAKLNNFQVQRIRLIFEIIPQSSYTKIGRLFGVSDYAIRRIVLNKGWL